MAPRKSMTDPVVTAARRRDWVQVRHLVESGSIPNLRDDSDFDALYYAIKGYRFDEMKFLLQHGADPNAKYVGNIFNHPVNFSLTAAEMAAANFPNLDQVLTLFLIEQPCKPEMLEMRALAKLCLGDRQSASECFFGPNSGNRNVVELFERYIQVCRSRWHGDISRRDLCTINACMLHSNQDALDTNTVASIVTNLISQQNLYVTFYCCLVIDRFQSCEVLDLLLSQYNKADKQELIGLILVMTKFVNTTILSFKTGKVSQETVSKLAVLVLKFPDKNEVLFEAVQSPCLDTIKFLVEQCRCNPHALKLETSESTLDLLFSYYFFRKETEKEQVRDSAKFLMDLGVHSCPRFTTPKGRNVLEDFPELFRSVRRLECLAASKAAEEEIDIDNRDLPYLIKKFIRQH